MFNPAQDDNDATLRVLFARGRARLAPSGRAYFVRAGAPRLEGTYAATNFSLFLAFLPTLLRGNFSATCASKSIPKPRS